MIVPSQPPKQAGYDGPPDMPMSLRFKYGIHTFFLLVEPLDSFSAITAELIEALHDRAEPILATTTKVVPVWDAVTKEMINTWVPADPIPVPDKDRALHVAFGVLKDPHDVSKGWKDLNIQPDDTPVSRGLKNNAELAFVVRDADQADESPEFNVLPLRWELENDEEEQEEDPAQLRGAGAEDKGKGKGKVSKSTENANVDMDEDEEL